MCPAPNAFRGRPSTRWAPRAIAAPNPAGSSAATDGSAPRTAGPARLIGAISA